MGTWEWRETPILKAIGDADAEAATVERLGAIVAATGLPRRQAAAGVQALLDDDYIDAIEVGTFGDDVEYLELRLLPKGREAYGSWPRPDDPMDALLRAIAAREEAATDPDERGRLAELGRSVRSVGEQVLAQVIANVITRGGA